MSVTKVYVDSNFNHSRNRKRIEADEKELEELIGKSRTPEEEQEEKQEVVVKAQESEPEPTDLNNKEQTVKEIQALQPRIRLVMPKTTDEMDWNMIRVFSHTMEFDQNPGRFVRFLVYDEVTGKYLGATSLGSDVIAIGCRDEWIGWDKDTKLKFC